MISGVFLKGSRFILPFILAAAGFWYWSKPEPPAHVLKRIAEIEAEETKLKQSVGIYFQIWKYISMCS